VTEARNESGFFYGSERLYNFLPHLRNKNAKEIGEAIISDVDKFTGDSRANDDLSLLIVKRN
jgi:serine phosphatase RsbU (regulator of sigma subunit)